MDLKRNFLEVSTFKENSKQDLMYRKICAHQILSITEFKPLDVMIRVILLQKEPLALAGGYSHGPGLQSLEAPHPALLVLLVTVQAGHTGHFQAPETLTRGHTAHQYPGDISIINTDRSHIHPTKSR